MKIVESDSPRPTSLKAPSLLPNSFPSSHAPSSPVSRPHPPPSTPFIHSTFLPLPPPLRPFVPLPFPSYHPPAFPPHPASLHFPSPSYRPPTIPSLLASLHSLLLRIRESGSCLVLHDMGLHSVFVCMFLFCFLDPWGLRSGCLFFSNVLESFAPLAEVNN